MPLRNACFISYRHGQHDLIRCFIDDFHTALSSELEPMLGGQPVYLDRERLQGGDFFPRGLARNLYESATMIMVYTPTYFDIEHSYCAKEYKAMEALEAVRLASLGSLSTREHGLIIPVILRGEQHLPTEIKQSRHFYNFDGFLLGGPRISRHHRFAEMMRQIASYVCDRVAELTRLDGELFATADTFCLPTDEDIAPFLSKLPVFRLPFPGREAAAAHSQAR